MPEKHKHVPSRDVLPGTDLWTDGLICAFEFIRGHKKPMNTRYGYRVQVPANKLTEASSRGLGEQKVMESSFSLESRDRVAVSLDEYNNGHSLQPSRFRTTEKFDGSYWAPIGWERISDLVKNVQVNGSWDSQQFEWIDTEDDLTVADLAAPYWERPAGPIWWCHLAAGNPTIVSWLNNAQWLHPAVSLALRDESKLISERMKHLLYE
ncbi:hypothetical protein Gorai_008408, partial [Gossypium raimondii]|nr:hypothetical protein [Gossypium raimondii]